MRPEEFGLTVEVEIIQPEQAAAYLQHNAKHRPIKQKKVEEYVEMMQADQWKLNGKVIVFDWNGRLLGGQHRLSACAISGVPLMTLVVRGVDPAVQATNE